MQTKIVNSRGTIYLQRFPVSPPLHKFGRPIVFLAIAASSVVITLGMNGKLDDTDNLFITSAYACFYLFIAGSLASVTSSRPPHKFYSLGLTVLCIVTILFLFMTLLSVFGVVTNNSVVDFFRSGYFSPGPLFIITVFLVMKLPRLLSFYVSIFKRMVLEIEECFHK